MFSLSNKSAETPQTTPIPSYGQPQRNKAGMYTNVGALCAILALFILPEVFGAAAAVLGAYTFRLDCGEQSRNRGLWVVVLGVVFMLVGIYYTSFFGLYDFLP